MQEGKKEVEESLFKIFEYPQIKDLINALTEKKVEETPIVRTIYNSKEEYVKALKEALPDLTDEDRETVKKAAQLNKAGYVIEIIEAFEKEKANEGN